MRIAIEATRAQGEATGFGQYVINLLRGLAAVAPENEYLLLYASGSWKGPDFGPQFRPVSYRLTGKQSLDILFNLNRVLRRERADVFHATCTIGVPPFPSVPCVSTIHDLYPLIAPRESGFAVSLFFRFLIGFSVRNSKRFLLDAAFSGDELRRLFGVHLDQMTAVHLAPCLKLEPRPNRPKDSFILCVGAIEPRKRQLTLVEAYKLALAARPSLPPLKLVGPDRGDGERMLALISSLGLEGKVVWSRYVPESELLDLYRNASLLVAPSSYEGFGLPPVEAAQALLPAICSDIQVFREVNGSWPVYVGLSAEDLAKGVVGFFAGEFDSHFAEAVPPSLTWEDTARKTLECYKRAMQC